MTMEIKTAIMRLREHAKYRAVRNTHEAYLECAILELDQRLAVLESQMNAMLGEGKEAVQEDALAARKAMGGGEGRDVR